VDRLRQRILEAVLALYPSSAPRATRIGIELECFVEPAGGGAFAWDEHLRRQQRVLARLASQAPTVASLGLEPGGQWELRSVSLDGYPALCAFARDDARIEDLLRGGDCRVAFQGVRPGGPTGRVISPEPRTLLLREYLDRRSEAAAAMMADTAACQLTLDPLPFADVLQVLRRVARGQAVLQRRWNPSGPPPSRRSIWRRVDPARCIPPPGMIDGSWSDEACLDHILSLPCIVVAAAGGRYVPFTGSFYDAVAAFPVPREIAVRFARFMKHIYYPVKPRVMAELRPLDSRPPARLPELHRLLADLALPGWRSSPQAATCGAAATAGSSLT
jgi:gamma-glutamylcysteine synthetase